MFFFCFCLELNLDKSHCNSRQCTYWHPWHLLTTPFTIPLFAPTLVILIPSLSHSVTEQFDSKYIITASDTGNLWDHLANKIFFYFVLVGQVSHLQCITNCASHAMLKPACITCVHHLRASPPVHHLQWCVTDSPSIVIFDILKLYPFQTPQAKCHKSSLLFTSFTIPTSQTFH